MHHRYFERVSGAASEPSGAATSVIARPGSGSNSTPFIQITRPPASSTGQIARSVPRNVLALQHFLHFAQPAGVTQPHPVARLPVAQGGRLRQAFAANLSIFRYLRVGSAQSAGALRTPARRCCREWPRYTAVPARSRSCPWRDPEPRKASAPARSARRTGLAATPAFARPGHRAPGTAPLPLRQSRARYPTAPLHGAPAAAAAPERAPPDGSLRWPGPRRLRGRRHAPAFPGRISCGASRASSACHHASSSCANSAICAKCSRSRGFQPSSSGSSSCRMRLRVKVRWRFELSSRQSCPSSRKYASISARVTPSSGRTMQPSAAFEFWTDSR